MPSRWSCQPIIGWDGDNRSGKSSFGGGGGRGQPGGPGGGPLLEDGKELALQRARVRSNRLHSHIDGGHHLALLVSHGYRQRAKPDLQLLIHNRETLEPDTV